MKTKKDIIEIAKAQMALDFNCKAFDFQKKNTIVENKLKEGRRIGERDASIFKAISFRDSLIISASKELIPWCEEKLSKRSAAWFFDINNLRNIDNKLKEFHHEIADKHQFFLPNPEIIEVKNSTDIKWYEEKEILQFKDDERFDEAFAFNEDSKDILAVAAVDGNTIMGMAGASCDSSMMWQIGINVLPGFEGKGIGTNLVTLLKNEILKRDKVPFYSTCESHINSLNIAINAGFFPAWTELYSGECKKLG